MPWSRTSDAVADEPSKGSGRVIVPVVTFVLGALLGGGGVGWMMYGDRAPAPAPPPPATSTPAATDSEAVIVPRACLEIADHAKILQVRMDEAMQAARDLDATKLSDLVRIIDEQQTAIRRSTEICRRGVESPTPAPDATGATSASPSATSSAAPHASLSPTAAKSASISHTSAP